MTQPLPNPFGDPEACPFVLDADAFMAAILGEASTFEPTMSEPKLLRFDSNSLRLADRRKRKRQPAAPAFPAQSTSVRSHQTRQHLSNQGVSHRSY